MHELRAHDRRRKQTWVLTESKGKNCCTSAVLQAICASRGVILQQKALLIHQQCQPNICEDVSNITAYLRPDLEDFAAAGGVKLLVLAQGVLHSAQDAVVLGCLAISEVHADAEFVVLHGGTRDAAHPINPTKDGTRC